MEQLIGKKVRYARADLKGNVHEGEGTVHGVFIGPDKRLQVRVHDGLNAEGRAISYNIDPVAVNATKAGLEKYADHLKKIEQISLASNKRIAEIAAAGNAEIEALNAAYMGAYYNV